MEHTYLLVLPIEPFTIGSTYQLGTSLPLHCTVMPWFALDGVLTFNHLNARLASLVRDGSHQNTRLVSSRPVLFGPNNDVPVHVLENSESLNLLHTRTLILLGAVGSLPKDLCWIGAGYRPHVTNTDREFAPGMEHVPEHLALVRKDADGQKEVVWLHAF